MRPSFFNLFPLAALLTINLLLLSIQLIHRDRLHRARRRSPQNMKAQSIVGIGIVHKRLFATKLEDFRGERDALRVAQAFIQIDDNSHILCTPSTLFVQTGEDSA
jgi:hypothetical protein